METVNSKHKKLSLQDILVRALHDQKDNLGMQFDHALIAMVAELQMPGSEAIQFGNTVFVTHYSPQSPVCAMYALNVDTPPNYIKNGEMYVRHLIKRGITGFVTSYTRESLGVPFKQIQRNRLGVVETIHRDGKFVTIVQLDQKPAKQQEQQNVQ